MPTQPKVYELDDGLRGSIAELVMAANATLPKAEQITTKALRNRIERAQRRGLPLTRETLFVPAQDKTTSGRQGGQQTSKGHGQPDGLFRKEADVKTRVKRILRRFGAWYTMPHQSGYSQTGVPDFLCCVGGRFVAIETKFGGRRPTALQQKEMADIRRSQGRSLVVDETNIGEVESVLYAILEGKA